MKYQTRKVKHLTDLQLLAQLHLGAKIYSKYAESALLLIFGGGKNKPYEAYEVFAHKYNFMHLAGVKSQTLGGCCGILSSMFRRKNKKGRLLTCSFSI